MQDFLAYTFVIGAVAFLIYKFFIPKKKKTKNCGNSGCGCA